MSLGSLYCMVVCISWSGSELWFSLEIEAADPCYHSNREKISFDLPCTSQAPCFFCATMFNGSSNIIVQGGIFIIAGNVDSARASLGRCSLTWTSMLANLGNIIEEMGVNISQNSPTELNPSHESGPINFCTSHGQPEGPTTDQFSYTQETNPQESCKSQADPAPRYSADNFGTSVHPSGQVPEPEYGLFLMPTPSTTSEVKPWETVGASWRNVEPNVDSHAGPPPFPMPSYFSEPQYGMSQNVLIQMYVTLIFLI